MNPVWNGNVPGIYDMENLSRVDLIIFVGYFALILVFGLWSGRGEGRTAREYFLAGDKLPWYVIGFSLVAASVNSEQMIGTVGMAYKEGMKIVNWEIWIMPLMPFLLFIFIPIYIRNRIATMPEFMEKRFGPGCRNYIAALTIFSYIFASLSVAVYGGAITLGNYFGINFKLAIWAIIAFVAVYSIYGGLSSVAWTDLIQTCLIMIGGIMLFCFAYQKIPGGFASMEAADPQRWHLIQPINDKIVPWPGLIIHNFTTLFFYIICSQFLMQKILAARDERDARVGSLFMVVLNAPRPLITAMAGLLAFYVLKEPLARHDEAFSELLKAVVPQGFRTIILIAVIAAMISTVAALVNSSSTLLTFDFYHKYLHKNADNRQLVMFGRITSLVILILVGLWCPMVGKFSGIFLYFQKSMSYFGTPIACVFLLGVLWKRINGTGAFTGMIVVTPLMFLAEWLYGAKIAFQYIAGMGWLLTFSITLLVSLVTKPNDPQNIKKFVWRKEMARLPSDNVPIHLNLWLWFALGLIIMLFWYIIFW